MALRDQPYLPLYIQDFMTDERLMECSAAATGVYIRLMCSLHKSQTYGKILLKQKYNQSDKQVVNFAVQLAKHFPFEFDIVVAGFTELLNEGVIEITGNYMLQKRMVNDGELSEKRAKAGKSGGKTTQKNNQKLAHDFAQAKKQSNTEIESENKNDIKTESKSIVPYTEPTENLFKRDLALALMQEFGFNEVTHQDKLRWIYQFLSHVEATQGLEYFQKTYTAYKKYKDLTGERRHNFTGLLGSPAKDFENAGWDSDNWQFKIDNHKPDARQTADSKRQSLNDLKAAARAGN